MIIKGAAVDENKVIKKLLDHDEEFEKVNQKIDALRDEFMTSQDEILTIVRRLDQERLFTFEKVKRLESDVEKVKKILKIA